MKKRSLLICFNSVNIRSDFWRRSLKKTIIKIRDLVRYWLSVSPVVTYTTQICKIVCFPICDCVSVLYIVKCVNIFVLLRNIYLKQS